MSVDTGRQRTYVSQFLHESTPGEINMTRFRNTYTTITTFVSAAVLLISTTVPASASPMTSDPLSSSTTTAMRAQVAALGASRTYTYVPVNNTSVDNPIVTAYWTPERMKNAIPVDTPTSTAEVNRQIDKLKQQASANEPVTDGSSPVTATLNTTAPQAVAPVTNFSKTNGKVFFRNIRPTARITCALEPPSIAVPSVWSLLLATVSMAVQEKTGTPIGYSHRVTATVPRMAFIKLPRSERLMTGSTMANLGEDSIQMLPLLPPIVAALPGIPL